MAEPSFLRAATSSLLPAEPRHLPKQAEPQALTLPALRAVFPALPCGGGNSPRQPRPSTPVQQQPESEPDDCVSKSNLPLPYFILRDAKRSSTLTRSQHLSSSQRV